jgi:Sad1 / UNC-like C-terminal
VSSYSTASSTPPLDVVVGTLLFFYIASQSFHLPTSIRDFYRYIRIDFHSHYSNEYYCPISLLRVYGPTHLEQWKWDTWEGTAGLECLYDSRPCRPPSESERSIAGTSRLAKEGPAAAQDSPPFVTPSDELPPDFHTDTRDRPKAYKGPSDIVRILRVRDPR